MKRMKKIIFILVGVCFVLASCTSDRAVKTVKQYTIKQFMDNIDYFSGSFSHDEKRLLISSNETGIYNAYEMPVEGGELVPLTQSDSNSVFAISFFPKDDRLLYHSDNDGDEIYHIFLKETDGNVKDLTPADGARSTFYLWNFDEESFLYGSNERDRRFMDIYEMDIEGFESKMIYKNDSGYNFDGISRDENYIVFTKSITTDNNEMYLWERETDILKHLSPHTGDVNYSSEGFSLDSKTLFYRTDEGSEFMYLMKYDIESGEKEKILEYDWDIWYTYLTYNGTYRVVGINEDAKTVVKIFDTKRNKEIRFPKVEQGNISSVRISKSEELMTFWVGSSRSPRDLFIYDLNNGRVKKLTNSLNSEIDRDDLVDGEVIRYKSFDGLEIPAILYKPHQSSKDSLAPALVWVHGGPGGQSRLSYFSVIQFLVNHGYVVLAVNNRGSSGYGKTFYKMDNKNHGEGDLMDCIMAKDYLASTGYVDTTRIGIIGGSYGGFMVMAALTLQPEEFAVGVNIFGVTNWIRTLKSIPPWWESFRKALYDELGDPVEDSARLYRISPLFHAEEIVKPFIVLQGANDPRVLQVESDEIVAAARENGVYVEYVLFEDEGHGFVKKENEIEGYGKILEFLDIQLKGIQ
ncbi:MAG: S9 family peptidase [Bacteroidales bacterium]|nr:MAG: S9 family peptidase [Bacteroidales bacterium]